MKCPRGEEGSGFTSASTAAVVISFTLLLVIVAGPTTAQESEWRNLDPATRPPARLGHAMAYDSESDRVILFGGETDPLSNVLNDETWIYDLNSNAWENVNPSSRPGARFAHAMAYDTGSDRVILFGGWTGMEQSTETWAYDYNTNTWTNMTPATSPPAGVFVQMAYDAESDRIVLFGGVGNRVLADASDETWAYDFDSNTWTQMNPGSSPSPRAINGMMAYDTASDRIVLFGGQDASGNFGDTWEYNYNLDTWAETSPETGPSGRHAGAMAYDASLDRVVLFGGIGAGASDETWIYDLDGDTWTRATTGVGPSRRFGAAMVYDTESDRLVLFGGSSGGSETWALRFVSPQPPFPWLLVAAAAAGAAAVAAVALLAWRRKGKRSKEGPEKGR